jgi:hypothetical protein
MKIIKIIIALLPSFLSLVALGLFVHFAALMALAQSPSPTPATSTITLTITVPQGQVATVILQAALQRGYKQTIGNNSDGSAIPNPQDPLTFLQNSVVNELIGSVQSYVQQQASQAASAQATAALAPLVLQVSGTATTTGS